MKAENNNIPKRANFRKVLSNGYWVFKHIYQLSPKTIILLTISTILMGVFPTLGQLYIAKIIDNIVNIASSGITTFQDIFAQNKLIAPIILYTLLQSISYFNNRLNWYLEDQIQHYYLVIFELSLEKRISDLDLQHFENPKVMDSIRKASDNVTRMYQFFYDSLDLIKNFVSVIISSYIVFRLSFSLGIFISILSIPGIIIMIQFINEIWNFLNSVYEKRRKSWWLSNKLKRPEHREESTITNSNIYIYGKVRDLWNFLGLTELKIRKKTFLKNLTDNFLFFIKKFISISYLILQTAKGYISVGQFTFYYQKISSFTDELRHSISMISNLWDHASYIQFIRDLFEIKPAITSGSKSIKTDTPPEIQFKNVWFKYPTTKKWVLKNINITIKSGDEIAIVGENGAGKTTLIKLLLRFYDPTKGEILINGIPLKDIDLNFYYRAIGALFQEYERIEELNVEENIKLGNINSTEGVKAVKRAAILADAEDFIEKLDKKYKNILHTSFTGGTKLSTGQWQKIALARMFYRDAPILILDEPTSSIDSNAEYRIFKRIFQTSKDKTLIIISHRFSTVRNAQKVYVLHEGKIVGQGTHKQLMAKKNGRYKKVFDLQAKGYTQ
jgi:ABC-type multidrug transport system fused ATPase/permease subunit